MNKRNLALLATLTVGVLACSGEDWNLHSTSTTIPTPNPEITLSSTAYEDEASIPLLHACTFHSGNNRSPEYSWMDAPEGTTWFALLMDDEVPPYCGSGAAACKHWSVFNIPAETIGLEESFNPSTITGVIEGLTYDATAPAAYAGPCPPAGSTHTYKTTIFALNENMPEMTGAPNLTRSQFRDNYSAYILGEATISGKFSP